MSLGRATIARITLDELPVHCYIAVIRILQRHTVLEHRFLLRSGCKEAAALAVRHPHAQRGALHALKRDRVRLLHAHVHETRLEAARLVLDEARLLRLLDALPRHEVQLRHQLAPVADAQQCQREGVNTRVERVELRLQLLVEQDCRCPLARLLHHVRIAEPTHQHLQ